MNGWLKNMGNLERYIKSQNRLDHRINDPYSAKLRNRWGCGYHTKISRELCYSNFYACGNCWCELDYQPKDIPYDIILAFFKHYENDSFNIICCTGLKSISKKKSIMISSTKIYTTFFSLSNIVLLIMRHKATFSLSFFLS